MKRYSSSLDAAARGVPLAVVILAIIMGILPGIAVSSEHKMAVLLTTLIPAIGLVILVAITYQARITAITVNDREISIERKLWPATLSLTDIKSVTPVDSMVFALRTFGNGGMFGYTGYFYKNGIGRMRWYCSQRTNYVLLEKTDGKKIVISPDDRNSFLTDLEQHLPQGTVQRTPL